MRTTIDIPEDLLENAMKVSNAKTKTMAIVLGLQELLHSRRIETLRGLRGKIDLSTNVAASRRR